MKSRKLRRILIGTGITFMSLVFVLAIHIYLVTRPKADEHTIVMARVDLKQPITTEEAGKITNWFYEQSGVDHVVCNAAMDNVVFTFYPVKANANDIVDRFRTGLGYAKAVRLVPSEKDLQGGCPVASTSYSYKVYSFFKHSL
jgi:hypothetical protein